MMLSDDGRWFVVAHRRYPVVEANVANTDMGGEFGVWHTRRCVVKVETGYEVSIIWGSGTYSTNHYRGSWSRYGGMFDGEEQPFVEDVDTVEVAVFDRHGEWLTGEPVAYVDADALIDLVDALAAGRPPND